LLFMQVKVKVALELSRKSVGALIAFGHTVVDFCTGNSNFTTPAPALADISTAIDELTTAAAAADNGRGSVMEVTTQRVKRIALEYLLTSLGQYVETTANDPANAYPLEHIVEVIESAGMQAKQVTIREKRVFAAKAGELPGTAKLVAAFVKRGIHDWQYSLTPLEESSWTSVPSTTKASTELSGLDSVAVYYFRHRA